MIEFVEGESCGLDDSSGMSSKWYAVDVDKRLILQPNCHFLNDPALFCVLLFPD